MKAPFNAPYYIYPALVKLKNEHGNLSAEEIAALKQHIALNAADAAAAVEFADLAGDDWAHIYPAEPEPEQITTDNAIDTFLNTYGSRNPKEDALLERLIFNPTPDYSQVLEKEEGNSSTPTAAPVTEQDAMIAAFINHNEADTATDINHEEDILAAIEQKSPDEIAETESEPIPETIAADAQPAANPASSLSESLAKIFIKQGRYERAFEIISDLNLNYPEKSVYFADQMRFLQKLIQLQQGRKQKLN
jgi:hypothetical protein